MLVSRAKGCLLGQLAGDSLGALVEFRSADSIIQEYPDGVRDMQNGGPWNIIAGQPTDDSELALMLARTLVKEKKYDANKVLEAYVHWYKSKPFDIGPTTGAALSAASRGDVYACRDSTSNGSLMRVSPLGIFFKPNEAAAWAKVDSNLTHPNPVCVDSCSVFVEAISQAIEGRSIVTLLDNVHPKVMEAVESAKHSPPEDYFSNQGNVLIALQNAFCQLFNAPNLEEGIIATVMAGGDTDTNAAIAGALLGSFYGEEAVPERWIETLLSCRNNRPQEFWPVDVLELAKCLVKSRGDNRDE